MICLREEHKMLCLLKKKGRLIPDFDVLKCLCATALVVVENIANRIIVLILDEETQEMSVLQAMGSIQKNIGIVEKVDDIVR